MTAVSDHATGAYSCAAVALGVELAMVRAHDLVESCDQLDLIAAASYDQWQWEPPLVLELEMPSPSVVQLNHMTLAVGMADELDDMTSPSAEEHQMTSLPEHRLAAYCPFIIWSTKSCRFGSAMAGSGDTAFTMAGSGDTALASTTALSASALALDSAIDFTTNAGGDLVVVFNLGGGGPGGGGGGGRSSEGGGSSSSLASILFECRIRKELRTCSNNWQVI